MPPPRWFGVGSADGAEPDAGVRAAHEALIHDDAKLLVVFCSQSYDLPELLAQIRACSAGVPVIGCTTAGEIATSGPGEAGVVVAAFGGGGFEIGTAAAGGASKDLRQAGARAARCLPSRQDRPYRVLLLLTDGLSGDQQEVVRGAYGVLGAGVPLVGGCAGDDLNLKMTRTFQLYDDHVLTDAVVAAGVAAMSTILNILQPFAHRRWRTRVDRAW
jgi:hypothetical protein